MKYVTCENGHKIKITGSTNKQSVRGKNRKDRIPEYGKLCVRCNSNIVDVIDA